MSDPNDIRSKIVALDWNNSDESQKAAVSELLHVDDRDLVLLAHQDNSLCSKNCWHNAAIVLKGIGYPRVKSVSQELLEWFQDLNWPGVLTIVELFKTFDMEVLVQEIQHILPRVISDNDAEWAMGLVYLMDECRLPRYDERISLLYNQLLSIGDQYQGNV